MEIPVFANVKYTDKEGFLTSSMLYYNNQLNQVLQNNLSDNGFVLPTLTQAELASIATSMPDGTMWYVHDTGVAYYELVIKINGALRKVTTSAYP